MKTRDFVTVISCVLATGASLGLTSCGDDESQPGIAGGTGAAPASPSPSGQPATGAVTISIPQGAMNLGNLAFGENPRRVTIGTTVTWVNNDTESHTVTADEGGLFDSRTMAPGATFSHTFDLAGTFPYSCVIHPAMKGVIEVTEPSAGPS